MYKTRSILFIALLAFTQNALGAFVSLNAGYEQFATAKMSDNNASFKGSNYQFEIGAQMRHTILTFFIKQSDLLAKVKHDDEEFSLTAKHISYGVKASFKVAKSNYLSLGYNISNIDNDFKNFARYNASGIKQAYDLDDNQQTGGLILGFGRNFYNRRGYSFFGEYNYIDHGSLDASSHVLYLGFRVRTNIKI